MLGLPPFFFWLGSAFPRRLESIKTNNFVRVDRVNLNVLTWRVESCSI